jgi:hypothetical protein
MAMASSRGASGSVREGASTICWRHCPSRSCAPGPLLCLAQAWLLIHRVELEPAAASIEAATGALPGSLGRRPPRTGRGRATRAYMAHR